MAKPKPLQDIGAVADQQIIKFRAIDENDLDGIYISIVGPDGTEYWSSSTEAKRGVAAIRLADLPRQLVLKPGEYVATLTTVRAGERSDPAITSFRLTQGMIDRHEAEINMRWRYSTHKAMGHSLDALRKQTEYEKRQNELAQRLETLERRPANPSSTTAPADLEKKVAEIVKTEFDRHAEKHTQDLDQRFQQFETAAKTDRDQILAAVTKMNERSEENNNLLKAYRLEVDKQYEEIKNESHSKKSSSKKNDDDSRSSSFREYSTPIGVLAVLALIALGFMLWRHNQPVTGSSSRPETKLDAGKTRVDLPSANVDTSTQVNDKLHDQVVATTLQRDQLMRTLQSESERRQRIESEPREFHVQGDIIAVYDSKNVNIKGTPVTPLPPPVIEVNVKQPERTRFYRESGFQNSGFENSPVNSRSVYYVSDAEKYHYNNVGFPF